MLVGGPCVRLYWSRLFPGLIVVEWPPPLKAGHSHCPFGLKTHLFRLHLETPLIYVSFLKEKKNSDIQLLFLRSFIALIIIHFEQNKHTSQMINGQLWHFKVKSESSWLCHLVIKCFSWILASHKGLSSMCCLIWVGLTGLLFVDQSILTLAKPLRVAVCFHDLQKPHLAFHWCRAVEAS